MGWEKEGRDRGRDENDPGARGGVSTGKDEVSTVQKLRICTYVHSAHSGADKTWNQEDTEEAYGQPVPIVARKGSFSLQFQADLNFINKIGEK